MRYVLDASLILARFNEERGGERLAEFLDEGAISAVTYVEVVTKLMDGGAPFEAAHGALSTLMLPVIEVTAAVAQRAAELRNATRESGLSLGDRICLATAGSLGATAVTADRAWRGLDIDVTVELVR